MFGFGRKRAIEARAKFLGDLMLRLVDRANAQPLEKFVEGLRRAGFVIFSSELGRERVECVFIEPGITEMIADFVFRANYEHTSGPSITATGYNDYSGVIVTGSRASGFGADLLQARRDSLGRDARALQAALLKYPGFENTDRILKNLGL
jgi:hypothetical protein